MMVMNMKPSNHTTVIYFIFNGISDVQELQAPVFLLVLLIYIITLGGNMTILILVCLDPYLHIPMYFFLVNLSLMDMSSITVTLHKILIGFISGNNTISFIGCMTQFYFFAALTGCELLILTAMSYDRYVAICNPLRYQVVMSPRVCAWLAILCWGLGFYRNNASCCYIIKFTCYLTVKINHFLCDILPLRKLTCSDTSLLDLSLFVTSTFHSTVPLLLTFIPYIFIIITIFRINSSTGRRKAFYTCSSHLTVVILLYVTLVCQYLTPRSMDGLESSKLFSLFNTAAVPMLNPLVYSLKNNAVKSALRRTLRMCKAMM